jgi:lipoate---protein ligase
MKHLDLTLPSPAANLACEEALLDFCEENQTDEILRFWESPQHFVVVGYANKIVTEVNTAVCAARNIPIFRRCSGGGTVLQGAGCLNYALILRTNGNDQLCTITSANRFIMERNLAAVESAFPKNQVQVNMRGHTDLTIDGLKFSGNSQRRKKSCLLFHGTFLLDFDLSLVSELLPMPSLQPDYRAGRPHSAFVTNLHLPAATVKTALIKTWNAHEEFKTLPTENIAKLAREKYSSKDWNFKF